MNWDAIGAIGEIIGALAVVLSLVYLARQMRTSNRLAISEAFRNANSQVNAINTTFGVNPEFHNTFRKVVNGALRDDMEPNERTMADFWLVSVCNIYDQLSRDVREGILDSSAKDFAGKGLFELPYFAEAWPLFKLHLNSQFVFEMERDFKLNTEGSPKW